MFKKPLDLNSPNKKNWLSRRLTPSHASIVNKYLKLQKDGHTRLYHILTATSQERNDKQLAKLVTEIQGLDSLSQQKLKEAISHELFSQKPVDYLAPLTHTIQAIKDNPSFASFFAGYVIPLAKNGTYDLKLAFQTILLLQQRLKPELHSELQPLLELWHTYHPGLFAELQRPGFLAHYDSSFSSNNHLSQIPLLTQQTLDQCLSNLQHSLKDTDFPSISFTPIDPSQLKEMSAFDFASSLTLSKVTQGYNASPCIIFSPDNHAPIWLLNPQLHFQYFDKVTNNSVKGTVLHWLLYSYKEQLLLSNKKQSLPAKSREKDSTSIISNKKQSLPAKSREKDSTSIIKNIINDIVTSHHLHINTDHNLAINAKNSQGEIALHILATLYNNYKNQHANDSRAVHTLTFLSTLLKTFLTLEANTADLEKLEHYQHTDPLLGPLFQRIIPKKSISTNEQIAALKNIRTSLENSDLWLLYRSLLSHIPKKPFQNDPFLNRFYSELLSIKQENQLDEVTWKNKLENKEEFFEFLDTHPTIKNFFIEKFSYPPFYPVVFTYIYPACFSLQKSILEMFFSGDKEDSIIILGLLRATLLPESSIPHDLSEDFHKLVTLLKAAVPNEIRTQWESTLNQAILSQNPLLAFEFLLKYPQFATKIALYLTELPYWAAVKSDLNIQEFCKEALLLPSRSMKEALTSLTNKIAEPVIKKEHFSDLVLPSNILSLLDLNDPYTVFAVLTENYHDQPFINLFLPFLDTTEIKFDSSLGFDATVPSKKSRIESLSAQLCNTLNYSNFDSILADNTKQKLADSLIKLVQADRSFRSILPEIWKVRSFREIILDRFLQAFSAEELRLMGLPLILKSSKLPLSQKEYDALYSSFKAAIEESDLDKIKLILDLREPIFNSPNSLLKEGKDSLSRKITDLLLEDAIYNLFEKNLPLLRELPINQHSLKLYFLKLRDESEQKIKQLPEPFNKLIKLPAFTKVSLEEATYDIKSFLSYVTGLEEEHSFPKNFDTLSNSAWNKPIYNVWKSFKDSKVDSIGTLIDTLFSVFSGEELKTLSLSFKTYLQQFDTLSKTEQEKLFTLFKDSINKDDVTKIKLILNFREPAYSQQTSPFDASFINEWLVSEEIIALFKEKPQLLVGLPIQKANSTLYSLKLIEEAKSAITALHEPFSVMAEKLLSLYKERLNSIDNKVVELIETLITLINEAVSHKEKQAAIGALFYQYFSDFSPAQLKPLLEIQPALHTLLFTCFAQLDNQLTSVVSEKIDDPLLKDITLAISSIVHLPETKKETPVDEVVTANKETSILNNLDKKGQATLLQAILDLSQPEYYLKSFSAALPDTPLNYSSAYFKLMIELKKIAQDQSLLPKIEDWHRKHGYRLAHYYTQQTITPTGLGKEAITPTGLWKEVQFKKILNEITAKSANTTNNAPQILELTALRTIIVSTEFVSQLHYILEKNASQTLSNQSLNIHLLPLNEPIISKPNLLLSLLFATVEASDYDKFPDFLNNLPASLTKSEVHSKQITYFIQPLYALLKTDAALKRAFNETVFQFPDTRAWRDFLSKHDLFKQLLEFLLTDELTALSQKDHDLSYQSLMDEWWKKDVSMQEVYAFNRLNIEVEHTKNAINYLPDFLNIMATKLLSLYREQDSLENVTQLLNLIKKTPPEAKQTAIENLFNQHFPDFSLTNLQPLLETHIVARTLLYQCFTYLKDKTFIAIAPGVIKTDITLNNATLAISPFLEILRSLDQEGQRKLQQAISYLPQTSTFLEAFLSTYPAASLKLMMAMATLFKQPSLLDEVSFKILPDHIKARAQQGWSEDLIKEKREFDNILLNSLSQLDSENPDNFAAILAHQETYISLEKEILEFRLQELNKRRSYSTSELEACYKEYIKNVTRFYEALKCQPTQLSFSYTLNKGTLSTTEENISRICTEEYQSFQDNFFMFNQHHQKIFSSLLHRIPNETSLKKDSHTLVTINKEIRYLLKQNLHFFQVMADTFKESITLTNYTASLANEFLVGATSLTDLIQIFEALHLEHLKPKDQLSYLKGILETISKFHVFVQETEKYVTQFHNTLPPIPFEALTTTPSITETPPSITQAKMSTLSYIGGLGYPDFLPVITDPNLFYYNPQSSSFFTKQNIQNHYHYIIANAAKAPATKRSLWQSLYQDLRSLYPSEGLAEVLEEAIDLYNKDMLSYNQKEDPLRYGGIGVRATYIVDELTQEAFFLITEVFDNSPAAKAQLKPGDKIFAAAQESNHFINISPPNDKESEDKALIRNALLIRGSLDQSFDLKIQREGIFYDITIAKREIINAKYQSVYHPFLEEKQHVAWIARKEMQKHTEDKIIEMFLESEETKSQLTPVAQQIITKLVKENDLEPQTKEEQTIKSYAEQIIQEHKPIKGGVPLRETIASIPKQSFVERVNKEFTVDHDKPAGARTVIPNNISNKNDIALI